MAGLVDGVGLREMRGQGMRCWLTIHWPISRTNEDYPAVWVRRDRVSFADTMREGDLVAVYETRTTQGRRPWGEGRVIWYGTVVERVHFAPPEIAPYDPDGNPWVLCARLEILQEGGVSLREMNNIFLYSPSYTRHPGLREVSEEVFDRLIRRRRRRG